ncbi:arylsulfatase [Catenovulum sediminis]|uniref:Arylsulfatase n=1 Tax=Catenovulum sediminis TaxID=1740262 RepID=A0ABV1REC5_9ALTE
MNKNHNKFKLWMITSVLVCLAACLNIPVNAANSGTAHSGVDSRNSSANNNAAHIRKSNVQKPNIVLIVTDDQGIGDIGFNQNPIIKTPNLDKLAQQSTALTNFHVDPTCSPTRAALLTGKHSLKAGVWHTILGRYMLGPEHQTLAEELKDNGYQTAIFGKWHLGDNYPYRPQDQGFDLSVIHGGGGVGQTPDYWGNTQFDDVYYRNGKPEFFSGYATKVWFDEAINFIQQPQEQPYFAYIALNAPHGPYRAPTEYVSQYEDMGLSNEVATFYGMITYIDEQVERLRETLRKTGQEENTIFIYMTDNGSSYRPTHSGKLTPRGQKIAEKFPKWVPNNGYSGYKGQVYEGGHRVPFLIYYPNGNLKKQNFNQLTAHYDVLPTLLDLIGSNVSDSEIDGVSLKPLLTQGQQPALKNRSVVVTNQRVYDPSIKRPTAVLKGPWRYITSGQKAELYHIEKDPLQKQNLLQGLNFNHEDKPNLQVESEMIKIAQQMNQTRVNWFAALAQAGFKDRFIHVGNPAENPARLNAMDWMEVPKGQPVPWFIGHQPAAPEYDYVHWLGEEDKYTALPWYINVEQSGRYRIRAYYHDKPAGTPINTQYCAIKLGDKTYTENVYGRASYCEIVVDAQAGQQKVSAWFANDRVQLTHEKAAFYLYIEYLGH